MAIATDFETDFKPFWSVVLAIADTKSVIMELLEILLYF